MADENDFITKLNFGLDKFLNVDHVVGERDGGIAVSSWRISRGNAKVVGSEEWKDFLEVVRGVPRSVDENQSWRRRSHFAKYRHSMRKNMKKEV